MMMNMEVAELRKGDRFVFVHQPSGTFGPADIRVIDVSLGGAQIQHPQPVRIGTVARFAFRQAGEVVSTQGRVIWSHLIKTAEGLVYRTGIRIQADTTYAMSVNAFYKLGETTRDGDSLERKRQRAIEREKARAATTRVIPTSGGVQ
jgi:hypothetical protein